MNITITFSEPVTLAIRDSFLKRFRVFAKYLDSPEGQLLYNTVVNEEILYLAIFMTDELGLPALTAAADRCDRAMKSIKKEVDEAERKFLGALFYSLMEANGYKKKKKENGDEDLKKPVPHKSFKSAQVYERILLNTNTRG